MSKLVLVIAAVAFAALFASKWKLSVQIALLFTVVEGALRKWVFPGASQYIYFVKDIFLLSAYCGYYTSGVSKRETLDSIVSVTALIACTAVVADAFNSNLGSLITGAFGAKAYIWYVPLIWVLPEVFESKAGFLRFTQLFVLLAVPLGLLAVLQYEAPLDSRLNVYVGDSDEIARFGEDNSHAMVTATFSYVGGYSSFLMFVACLLIPYLVAARKATAEWCYAGMLALLIGNMCMAGGRKNFILVLVYLIVLAFLALSQPQVIKGLFKCVIVLAIAVGVALVLFRSAADAIMDRTANAGDFTERTQLFFPLLQDMGIVPFFGYGTGVSLADRSGLTEALNLPPPKIIPPYIDFEAHQILYELGPVGFFAWHALKLALIYALWQTGLRIRDLRLKLLAYGALSFHIAHFYLGTYLNHISNIYFWFFAGFILLLPKLDAETHLPVAATPSRGQSGRRGRCRSQAEESVPTGETESKKPRTDPVAGN